MEHHHESRHERPPPAPTFKNILGFCPFRSPIFPRKHQGKQIKSNFCPILPICPDIRHDQSRKGGGNRTPFGVWRAYKRDTPPIWGAARALCPHNFSHQKYSKKSAYPWVEKISEKICGKMFRGKKKAPNLVERGRETLKYERIKFGAKIVELFVIARGKFFHFVFVP